MMYHYFFGEVADYLIEYSIDLSNYVKCVTTGEYWNNDYQTLQAGCIYVYVSNDQI